MIVETAYAKINLALHVRARDDDGYHAIETIFAFAKDGDRLTASPAADIALTIVGPEAEALMAEDVETNLVLRAARAVRSAFGVAAGATLHLDKRLPLASGIGGGSADAAAALRALARLWKLPPDDPRFAEIAADLGADVPACLTSRTAWADARGDRLRPLAAAGLAGTPLLLVNPRIACPTGPVFRGWDGVDRGALGCADPIADAIAGRNDLQPPAVALVPAIADTLSLLMERPGATLARMSGSGATCFALFASLVQRDAVASAIGSARPDWWCLVTELK